MTPYVADPVYLNGQFLPLDEASQRSLDALRRGVQRVRAEVE